ncbi:hypothetical protein E8E14_003879 [Neopestalotiopsis sp. 37M]|nr:hypothetical protein E8E14_003879 [Neopestalotiopsis sp. 37M]
MAQMRIDYSTYATYPGNYDSEMNELTAMAQYSNSAYESNTGDGDGDGPLSTDFLNDLAFHSGFDGINTPTSTFGTDEPQYNMSSVAYDQPYDPALDDVPPPTLSNDSPLSAGVVPAMLEAGPESAGEIPRVRFEEIELPSAKDFEGGKNKSFSCDKNKGLVGRLYWSRVSADKKEVCPKRYGTGRDLKKHLRTHVMPVICPTFPACNIRTAEQADMREHLRVSHPEFARQHPEYGVEFGPFYCEKCPKKFSRSDNLTKHVNNNVCGQQ